MGRLDFGWSTGPVGYRYCYGNPILEYSGTVKSPATLFDLPTINNVCPHLKVAGGGSDRLWGITAPRQPPQENRC
jgi:hypothetical protein